MVNGLLTFQRHFADYRDAYLLIGGCACDIHFEGFDLPFRTTKDLDIVLCVEALNDDFLRAFWQFIRVSPSIPRISANTATISPAWLPWCRPCRFH